MSRPRPIVLMLGFMMLSACDGGSSATATAAGPAPSVPKASVARKPYTDSAVRAAPNVEAGVLLVAFAGNGVASMLDQTDRVKEQQAEKRACSVQLNQKVTWSNDDHGTSGTLTPIHDGYSATGAYCRDFQETLVVGAQQRQGVAKACQQPDGSWRATK